MKTKYLAVSALLSALGVILLGAGALFETLDLTTAAFASVLCLYAVLEIGSYYPWMLWGVTSALGLLLLPQKTPAIFYLLFFGFYPIVKKYCERLRKTPCLLCKVLTFHGSLGLTWGALRLFFPAELEDSVSKWFYPACYALALVCFCVYDFLLSRLTTLYLVRLKPRLEIK